MATCTEEPSNSECPVCHEHYIEPKILPCTHLLCRKCLDSLIDKSNTETLCPLCRRAVVNKQNNSDNSSCKRIASSFPTDLAMAAVVESRKLLSREHVCCVCDNVAAVSLCLHCGAMLCQPCVRVHSKLPTTQAHKMEALATLTPEVLACMRQSPCPNHTDKTTELFCTSHNIPTCYLCTSLQHRSCPQISDIQEVVKQCQETFSDLRSMLLRAEDAFKSKMAKFDNFTAQAEENKIISFINIDSACDRIQRCVETYRQLLKKEVSEIDSKIKELFRERREHLGNKLGRVTAHRQLIERIQRTVPCYSIDAMKTAMTSRLNELDLDTSVPTYDVSFTAGTLHVDIEVVCRIERELSEMKLKKNLWNFHKNHGSAIVLSNNGLTAESTQMCNSIVVSNIPMDVNSLYEVHIEETDSPLNDEFVNVGVMTENPSTVNLPMFADELESAIIFCVDNITTFTHMSLSTYGQALQEVRAGNRVGIAVDTSGGLHLYVNGKDQGAVYRGIKQPYYALFDFLTVSRKITALPITRVRPTTGLNGMISGPKGMV